MAGFYIVVLMFILIAICAAVVIAFEAMSVLSIIFSAISLSKSNKFIAAGGRADYRQVKRFHKAALVFFAISCAGLAVTGLAALSIAADYIRGISDVDIESVLGAIMPVVVGLGKYVVLMILGIKSFKKFSQARDLYGRLCAVYCGGNVNGAPDKICPKCGRVNEGRYRYCTFCGEKLC